MGMVFSVRGIFRQVICIHLLRVALTENFNVMFRSSLMFSFVYFLLSVALLLEKNVITHLIANATSLL